MEYFSNKKKVIFTASLVLLLGSLFGYYYYRPYQARSLKEAATQEYQKIFSDYRNMAPGKADWLKASQEMDAFLNRYADTLSSEEEGFAKIMLANLIIVTDHKRATDLFKEVAQSEHYPNNIRALALNYLIDDYEVNFIHPDRGKIIFTGDGFENLLSESGGDLSIAIRKLSEQSIALTPNAIAHYRIAKWYASGLNKNIALSEEEKIKLREKINTEIAAGDPLLRPGAPPDRLGLAYALKARNLSLVGGKPEEVEKYFKLSQEAYFGSPAVNAFQVVYGTYDRFYYAAFLARTYGSSRAKDIRALLQPWYEYSKTTQYRPKRGARQVSFLIAARSSKTMDYPAPDFNETDIKRLGAVYPEFVEAVEELDIMEYLPVGVTPEIR